MASAPKSGVEGVTSLDDVRLSIKAPPNCDSDEEVGLGVDVETVVDVEDEIMSDVVVVGLAVLTASLIELVSGSVAPLGGVAD